MPKTTLRLPDPDDYLPSVKSSGLSLFSLKHILQIMVKIHNKAYIMYILKYTVLLNPF